MEFVHFKYKIWLRDWFSSVPNVLFVKKRLQFICTYSTYVRTFEQEEKSAEGVQLSETTLPELKRARQTANVTAGVWSRDSLTFAVTRIQKQTWI